MRTTAHPGPTAEFRALMRDLYPRPSRLPQWAASGIAGLWLLAALLNVLYFARTVESPRERIRQSLGYGFLYPIWHIDQDPAAIPIGSIEVPRQVAALAWVFPAALCGLLLYGAYGTGGVQRLHRAAADAYARQQGRIPPHALPASLFLPPGASGVPLAKVGAGTGERVIGIPEGTSRGHALCVAPTGAGKGLHLTDTMLMWQGPALLVDPKGEMYERTATHRRMGLGLGPCYNIPKDALDLLDYFRPDDPLDVHALHELLLETWRDRDPIWVQKSLPIFFAAMTVHRTTGRHGLQVLARWAKMPLPEAMVEAAAFAPEEVRQFLDSVPPEKATTNKFAMGAWGTFTAKFAKFAPFIGTFSHRDVPATWVEQDATIYITYPLEQARTARPLVAAAVAGLIRGRMRAAAETRKPTPVLFCLDELPAFAIPALDTYLATVRSAGIMLVLYVQQLSQLRDVYGPETAETIMGNCHYHLYFASNDLKMAQHISAMLGTKLGFVQHQSRGQSQTVGSDGRSSRQTTVSYQRQEVPTLPPAEVQKRLPDDAVVVYAPMGQRKGIVIARRLNSVPQFAELEGLPQLARSETGRRHTVDLTTPLVTRAASPTPMQQAIDVPVVAAGTERTGPSEGDEPPASDALPDHGLPMSSGDMPPTDERPPGNPPRKQRF